MFLTGIVAILSADRTSVVRVDDYGTTGAEVKAGQALPLIESQPTLGSGQVYGTPTFAIGASSVTRTWPVITLDFNAIDQATLNAALAEPGSAFRALSLLMLDRINAIDAAINALNTKANLSGNNLPQFTQAQLVTALQAKIR